MTSEWYKFYITGAAGGTTPSADELYYHWAVIHPTMMLATKAPMENFVRYNQNYVNPEVPDEVRVLPNHPSNLRILSDHWLESFEGIERSIHDPTHRHRLGRHMFGDHTTVRTFFGRGGPVYRSPEFKHPAALTISHWLGLREDDTRDEAIARLQGHKAKVVSKLKDFNRGAKYSIDICDDYLASRIESSGLKTFPWKGYFAVEMLQFSSKHDGFEFIERHRDELRASYTSFVNQETSHSLFAVERVVFDFTDDNPSTKTPLPVFFTDKESCEYRVQHEDWNSYLPSFALLDDTKWASARADTDRSPEFVKALDPDSKWT